MARQSGRSRWSGTPGSWPAPGLLGRLCDLSRGLAPAQDIALERLLKRLVQLWISDSIPSRDRYLQTVADCTDILDRREIFLIKGLSRNGCLSITAVQRSTPA